MARYKIYDNTSDVITPVGEKLTAEQWLDRYQWGRYTKMIVGGGLGMVEMALDRLNENKVVELDDERKAAMVSNLLVVLCGNRDAQPIVNSGSLY